MVYFCHRSVSLCGDGSLDSVSLSLVMAALASFSLPSLTSAGEGEALSVPDPAFITTVTRYRRS